MDGIGRQLEDAGCVLVLASPLSRTSAEVCMDLLAGEEPAERNVLSVLFTRRPDRQVEDWRRHVGDLPGTFEILHSQPPSRIPASVDVETVDDPGDLTATGVAITGRIAEWGDDRPGSFCLHSATAQLQYATTSQVYQFLFTLAGHLAAEDVRGHVHMNPAAHDGTTVDTIETVFDAAVEVAGDESTVRTR